MLNFGKSRPGLAIGMAGSFGKNQVIQGHGMMDQLALSAVSIDVIKKSMMAKV